MISQLISLYRKTVDNINSSISGKCKFNFILQFFSECENVIKTIPPFSLIKDLIPTLLDVILKSDINFTDPAKLSAAKYILNGTKKEYQKVKGGELIIAQVEKAVDILNMQILKSLFYLGRYDDGLIVLSSMLKERDSFFNQKDETREEIKKVKTEDKQSKFALVNHDFYKESKAYEILSEIKNELDRLNSFSDTNINIMLVEQEGVNSKCSNGTIQSLLCDTLRTKNEKDENMEFENITDLDDSSLQETLKNVRYSANKEIKIFCGKSVSQHIKRKLKFENLKGVYKGASLGLGASVLCVCNYFNFSNSRKRYRINNAAAFTGEVYSDGTIAKVNSESIKNKIESAFFSWVKYCVIPEDNLAEANEAYEKLKNIYPEKELNIISVKNISEVFATDDIIKEETVKIKDYAVSVYNRHRIISIASMLIITALLAFFLADRFLPKDIKPLPKPESEMSLIYAPDRDTNWIFTNSDMFGGDTINYGDVAIGDEWYPIIEFWNNSRTAEEFNIYLDGADKDEFELTYIKRTKQPEVPKKFYPDNYQNIFVKFIPTKSQGKKNAKMILENKKTLSRKEIYLKGESKRLGKGYCINISEPDDELVLETNRNLLNDNFTIAFWIKPYTVSTGELNQFFVVENNPLSNNKFKLYLNENDSNICVRLFGSKSREMEMKDVQTKLKFNYNNWNYLAITFSDTLMNVVLNDKIFRYSMPRNMLRQMNEFIYFGRLHVEDRNFAMNDSILFSKFYLDEVRIYNIAIQPEELIKNKYNLNYRHKDLIAGYTFDDANTRQVYDESTNDNWPKLYGGIKRVIDESEPFKKEYQNIGTEYKKNVVFCRSGKGFLRLNKNLYSPGSSFTFQSDFKLEDIPDKKPREFFPQWYFINRTNLDFNFGNYFDSAYICINNLYQSKTLRVIKPAPENTGNPAKWHRYTLCYDATKNEYRFYIDSILVNTEDRMDFQDITQNYMGMSFALQNYFNSPRFSSFQSYIDNIKLFNRPISHNEIYSDTRNGLIAFWDFQRTDKELAYDEISNLPLLMWQPFKLINEEIRN